MSTKKKVKRVFAYAIETPVYDIKNNSFIIDRYDNQRFEPYLREIKNIQNENDRKLLIDQSKLILLDKLQDSMDSDFLEGTLIASRFGEQQDIFDVDTLVKTGELKRRDSVKGEVSFILCKKTGLLLVQSDSSLVVNRNSIDRYFMYFEKIIKRRISEFNLIDKNFSIPSLTSFFTIRVVPSDDFFKKIRQLARVKGATVIVDMKKNPNNQAINYFRQQAEEKNVDNFGEIAITLINKKIGTGIRNVEDFFRNLIEMQRYDKYIVEGKTQAGRNKTVTMGIQDTSFEVKVPINENGIIDRSVLLNEMINIAKFQNPLKLK
jgi:hypothetical protein